MAKSKVYVPYASASSGAAARDEPDQEDDRLRSAVRNIAALNEEGIMNVINGNAVARTELRKNFEFIADKIKAQ